MKQLMKKILLWSVLLAGCIWFIRYITTPPPGRAIEDQGREHVSVEVVESTQYKSTPPVSGPHLATWVKPGIYTDLQQKGELIHSLEHGYVEVHYNCTPEAPTSDATPSAQMDTPDCKSLVGSLEGIATKEKLWKLLVVRNPAIAHPIVLAAWGRIEEMDAVDEKRIIAFIRYWRDHGPEQTME